MRSMAGEVLGVALALMLATPPAAARWQGEWTANSRSRDPEYQAAGAATFTPAADRAGLRLLLTEGDTAFVGANNHVFHMSLTDMKNISTLEWKEDKASQGRCKIKGKNDCSNYIRVITRKSDNKLYICGTNAYNPKCRHYNMNEDYEFEMARETTEDGKGVCPFDPNHNSTATMVDDVIFSGTVADEGNRKPIILRKNGKDALTRSRQDSMLLNEPQFVNSFEKEDKVFFFFRENAVENINCGKAVFSRVGRVCKKDKGEDHRTYFKSFFKARLNCSIPGDYPFYFDEIQATSTFGQGNFKPTKDSGDRHDLIYGVFSTPENAIQGSAICAFRYSKIKEAFRHRFKGQASITSNWLPVDFDQMPKPNVADCDDVETESSYNYLQFIKKHSLMDEAVKAEGGMPVLVHTSFKSKFTSVAVDWQRKAADGNYYDVLFVGTDDGRVIKSVNSGSGDSGVAPAVVEDLQVLSPGEAVVDMRVVSDRTSQATQKLVVVSSRRMVTLPLHRCHRAASCRKCVALQDPYCVWKVDKCVNAEEGIQSIASGEHEMCRDDSKDSSAVDTAESKEPESRCDCQSPGPGYATSEKVPKVVVTGNIKKESTEDSENEPATGSQRAANKAGGTEIEMVILAVTLAILLSLISGFLIGYKIHSCRTARDRDSVFYETKCSTLQRGRSRLSSGDNPYFHTDSSNLTPKKMNYAVNIRNSRSGSTDTKPVTKSNKVYL